jgi:hypothetical protein
MRSLRARISQKKYSVVKFIVYTFKVGLFYTLLDWAVTVKLAV